MATGPEMMLKALGFDPKATVEMVQAVVVGLNEMNMRLGKIEAQNEEILAYARMSAPYPVNNDDAETAQPVESENGN